MYTLREFEWAANGQHIWMWFGFIAGSQYGSKAISRKCYLPKTMSIYLHLRCRAFKLNSTLIMPLPVWAQNQLCQTWKKTGLCCLFPALCSHSEMSWAERGEYFEVWNVSLVPLLSFNPSSTASAPALLHHEGSRITIVHSSHYSAVQSSSHYTTHSCNQESLWWYDLISCRVCKP